MHVLSHNHTHWPIKGHMLRKRGRILLKSWCCLCAIASLLPKSCRVKFVWSKYLCDCVLFHINHRSNEICETRNDTLTRPKDSPSRVVAHCVIHVTLTALIWPALKETHTWITNHFIPYTIWLKSIRTPHFFHFFYYIISKTISGVAWDFCLKPPLRSWFIIYL